MELAVFFLAISAGAPQRQAVLALLATATVWIALAAGALSAGPGRGLDGLLRGGITADATGVVLLGLWLWTPFLTFLGAVKVYCVLAAMALAAVAVVRVGRTRHGRAALAGVMAIALMLAMSTPLWANGLMVSVEGDVRQGVVAWCVDVNPFFAIANATVSSLGLVWHESPALYAVTVLGDRIAVPRIHWYVCVAVMLTLTGIALAARLIRPPTVSPAAPEDPPAGP